MPIGMCIGMFVGHVYRHADRHVPCVQAMHIGMCHVCRACKGMCIDMCVCMCVGHSKPSGIADKEDSTACAVVCRTCLVVIGHLTHFAALLKDSKGRFALLSPSLFT